MSIKLYKFYKENCPPCYALQRLLNRVDISNFEIIPMNVENEDVKEIAKEKGLSVVPTLLFDDGKTISGKINEKQLREFLGG